MVTYCFYSSEVRTLQDNTLRKKIHINRQNKIPSASWPFLFIVRNGWMPFNLSPLLPICKLSSSTLLPPPRPLFWRFFLVMNDENISWNKHSKGSSVYAKRVATAFQILIQNSTCSFFFPHVRLCSRFIFNSKPLQTKKKLSYGQF